jgi:hypothetical protein
MSLAGYRQSDWNGRAPLRGSTATRWPRYTQRLRAAPNSAILTADPKRNTSHEVEHTAGQFVVLSTEVRRRGLSL